MLQSGLNSPSMEDLLAISFTSASVSSAPGIQRWSEVAYGLRDKRDVQKLLRIHEMLVRLSGYLFVPGQ